MKKNIILGIIIALLVICVAVEGFFLWKQNSDKKKEEGKGDTEQVEQTPSPEPSKEPKKLPKDEVIDGENIKISKKYSNPKGNEVVYTYLTVTVEDKANYNPEYDEGYWKYTYEIPQIDIDSKDVEKINKDILKKYEDIFNEINKKQEIDFECESLSYEYYENDGVLSLVMVNPTESGGCFICETYNIDISKQKEINNKELLEKIEIDEKDLNDKILKAIEGAKLYSSDESTSEDLKTFIKEQESKTTDKYKKISVDDVEIYLNEENNLCAYLEVYAIAGGETMTIILDLEENEIVELDKFGR